ncbi:DUF2271 domain-containing protein [Methylibium sp.]|uniref:DUF2271 domain-containing protein n=1 Tax=Methylibium sp. TaxID=2067992 RepID=UPI003D0AA1E7
MHLRYSIALSAAALGAPPLFAADLAVGVEVPRLSVAEYHRPYVSVWIARPDQSTAANLAVWFEQKKPNAEGRKWLKDLRQWWRRSGRELQLPVDGVTSATRPVGKHKLAFSDGAAPLGTLAAGDYQLMVEAAREDGGRELLAIPFQWPPAKLQQLTVQGKSELGEISLELKP